ncbi:MAG: serine/threonine-protein kinase, partial [Planctomycetota bacterium]
MASEADTIDPGPEPGGSRPGRGKTLGPYRILEEIGRGGMGVVYKAFHPQLKRTVALKVLIAGEDASNEAIERFHREAESVAKLGHHPHIVPVYDIGAEANRHYFAMHYVEGKPLDRLIDDGEIAPKRAATIAGKLAEALHHAHEHGILHRDVKPANILVTRDGEPQLTDFGLAKDVASESKMTRSGVTLGTPNYMPPEQADGRLDDIDERSDVYSLGATLYEMLTMRPPFDGSTVIEVIQKVMLRDPVSPRKGNSAVDADLETICLKCLEKSQSRRYGTGEELAEDLTRYLEGRSILARPVSPVSKLVRRAKRNRAATVAVMVLLVVVAVAGALGIAVMSQLSRTQEEKADKERDLVKAEKRGEETAEKLTRSRRMSRVLMAAVTGLRKE